jgi:hypothetical protein
MASGKVNVKLTGDQTNNGIYEQCGANESLFGTWIRLPGTVDSNGYLPDAAEALPAGTYDVCALATMTGVNKQTTNSSGSFSGTTQTSNLTLSLYRVIGTQKLAYQGNANPDFTFDKPQGNEGDSTTCAGATWT